MSSDIARCVERVRDDVLYRALAGAPPQGRTIIADIVTRELLDHIGDALARSDTTTLELWLEQVCQRHAALPNLDAVFQRTCSTLMEIGRSEGWLLDNELGPVARAIGQGSALLRAATTDSPVEAIDEIDVIINDLIARLFEKDVITGEHSRAVALWCLRLARNLGFSAADAQLVQRGGLLHDIGKIATPNEILNAPRRLSTQERLVIERHPIDGVDIVVDVPQLGELLPMVRSHHERLDGKGYPDGLRGEQIPITARIVSVADCFNAMVGRRPYRPPLAPSFALEELRRHAGTQFDPEVVEAMATVAAGHAERL